MFKNHSRDYQAIQLFTTNYFVVYTKFANIQLVATTSVMSFRAHIFDNKKMLISSGCLFSHMRFFTVTYMAESKFATIFRNVLFAVFFIHATIITAQIDTLKIGKITFLVKRTTAPNEFGTKDTLVKLYRLEAGKKVYLLTHYIYKYEADCNNEFTDIGKYEIRNDSLIFNTIHQQKTGIDPIPVQSRQIYIVQKSGKLKKVFDKVLYRDLKMWKGKVR